MSAARNAVVAVRRPRRTVRLNESPPQAPRPIARPVRRVVTNYDRPKPPPPPARPAPVPKYAPSIAPTYERPADHPQIIQAFDGQTYELGKRLGRGSFGCVYDIRKPAEINGRKMCVKLEEVRPKQKSMLQTEQRAYSRIAQSWAAAFFPSVGSLMVSEDGRWRFLVIEKGGHDLLDMIDHLTLQQKLKCLRHCVQALMYLHEDCDYVHRDIKPENILLRPDGRGIMFVDWGFIKRFRTFVGNERRHIPYLKNKKGLNGTLNYASTHTLMRSEASRRDDLESLVYTFVVVCNLHRLPWTDVAEDYAIECMQGGGKGRLWEVAKQIGDMKRASSPDDVVGAASPPCLLKMMRHIRTLQFAERPAYEMYIKWIEIDERNA